MEIRDVLKKAANKYKAVGSFISLYNELEWQDIESADNKKRRIYYLAQEVRDRLRYFIPSELMPYVCGVSSANYADPKYNSYKDEIGKWNGYFVYVWVPGALPFVITDFWKNKESYEALYENVRYIVPLCVNDMEVWKWQKQEDTTWLPHGKNDRDTIWKVIGYCVNKRISMESGGNNPEYEEVNEDGEE